MTPATREELVRALRAFQVATGEDEAADGLRTA
jgi:hypothetical protein